jgi:hypothetical protein
MHRKAVRHPASVLAKFGAAAVMAAVAAPSAYARCQIDNVAPIPVAPTSSQLLTRGAIDGHPVSVLIDTGSYMSSFGARRPSGSGCA